MFHEDTCEPAVKFGIILVDIASHECNYRLTISAEGTFNRKEVTRDSPHRYPSPPFKRSCSVHIRSKRKPNEEIISAFALLLSLCISANAVAEDGPSARASCDNQMPGDVHDNGVIDNDVVDRLYNIIY